MSICTEAELFCVLFALRPEDPDSLFKIKAVRMDVQEIEIKDSYIESVLRFLNFKGDQCVVETPSGKRWVERTRNKFHISYYPTETIKPEITLYQMDHNIFCDS